MTATPGLTRTTHPKKEHAMTTKTPAPMTAHEARALADKLATEERDIENRRREARKAAELAEAKATFVRCDTEMMAAINEANAQWSEAWTAEPLDVNALAAAFLAVRGANAARSQSLATANAVANGLEPKYGQGGGQVDHRRDWRDVTEGASFAAELDRLLTGRISHIGSQSLDDTNDRIHGAGRDAADAVH